MNGYGGIDYGSIEVNRRVAAWNYNTETISKRQYIEYLTALGLDNFAIIRELKWAERAKKYEQGRRRKRRRKRYF